jgi:hypothetical protein
MTNEKQKVYVITTMYIPHKSLDKDKWPYHSSRDERTVGFFFKYEDAEQCVLENWGDIIEARTYNIAVIEEITEGLYPFPSLEQWFKLVDDEDRFEKMDKPKCFDKVINFGIG